MNMDELKNTLKNLGYIITKPIDDDDNIRLIIKSYTICGTIIVDKNLVTASTFALYIQLQSYGLDSSITILEEIDGMYRN